jgi:hypothetical protein
LQAYFATKKARLFNAAVRPAKLKSYAGAGRTAYLVILFRCYPNPKLKELHINFPIFAPERFLRYREVSGNSGSNTKQAERQKATGECHFDPQPHDVSASGATKPFPIDAARLELSTEAA